MTEAQTKNYGLAGTVIILTGALLLMGAVVAFVMTDNPILAVALAVAGVADLALGVFFRTRN